MISLHTVKWFQVSLKPSKQDEQNMWGTTGEAGTNL